MKKQTSPLNPLSFGLIYFGLFVLAMVLNKDGQIILFPKPATHTWTILLVQLGSAAGFGLLVVAVCQWVSKYIQALKDLESDFFSLLGPLSVQDIFFLAVFSSIGEEFLFRGIVQHYLGVVVTSLIFGLLHSAPGKQGRVWSIFAIIMGFALGLSYQWTENILVPITIHIIVNFFNLWILRVKSQATTVKENQ